MSNSTFFTYFLLLSFGLSACATVSGKRSISDLPSSSHADGVAFVFVIDKSIAKRLAPTERTSAYEAEIRALEFGISGREITWSGETAKVFGSVVAYRPFRVGKSNCRRFDHSVSVGKQKFNNKGTACRVESEPWKLIN